MLAPLGKAVAEVQLGAAPAGRGGVRGRAVPAGEKNYFKKNELSLESPLGSTASPLHGLAPACLSFPSHPAGISAGGQDDDTGTLDQGQGVADGWRGARTGDHVLGATQAPS